MGCSIAELVEALRPKALVWYSGVVFVLSLNRDNDSLERTVSTLPSESQVL